MEDQQNAAGSIIDALLAYLFLAFLPIRMIHSQTPPIPWKIAFAGYQIHPSPGTIRLLPGEETKLGLLRLTDIYRQNDVNT